MGSMRSFTEVSQFSPEDMESECGKDSVSQFTSLQGQDCVQFCVTESSATGSPLPEAKVCDSSSSLISSVKTGCSETSLIFCSVCSTVCFKVVKGQH